MTAREMKLIEICIDELVVKNCNIPVVSGLLPADMEVKAEIVDRIGRKHLDREEDIKRVVWYEKGFTDCIDWLRKRQ